MLVTQGDSTYLISLWKMGYIYYLDLLFIILGLVFLFKHYRKVAILLASLVLLSPIPEAIRSDTVPAYAFHSSFQYPFLQLIVGAGFFFFLQSRIPKFFKYLTVLIYLINILLFINLYFFRYPIYQSEGFNFSRRLASRFIELELQKDREVFVITNEPGTHLRSFLFYTNGYQQSNYDQIANIYRQPTLERIDFGRLHLTIHQEDVLDKPNATIIVESSSSSINFLERRQLSIHRPDGFVQMYRIYSPTSCSSAQPSIPSEFHLSDLDVENQTENDFCQKFIKAII